MAKIFFATPPRELGGSYFDTLHVEAQRKRLLRKLESLGVKVTVAAVSEAA